MPKLKRLPTRQAFEILRQFVLSGHLGAVNEYRDHGNVALERPSDLDADIVLVALNPAPPLLVLSCHPMRPDKRKQHVALRDLGIKLLDEIAARLDGVDIDEEIAAREVLGEMIVQPARYARSVVSPVVDEDAAHDRAKRSSIGRGPPLWYRRISSRSPLPWTLPPGGGQQPGKARDRGARRVYRDAGLAKIDAVFGNRLAKMHGLFAENRKSSRLNQALENN